jgi:hypothetical protein
MHPLRHQRGLTFGHGAQETEVAICRAGQFRIVAGNGVIGELVQHLGGAMRRHVLEGADAQMTRGDPRQDRPGQGAFPIDRFAGRYDGQRARGGNPQRLHRLADQHLAQHRSHRRLAITPAGKRGPPGALEGDIATLALAVEHLTDQQCAAIAQLGIELTELMSRVGLRDGLCALGQGVAGKDGCQCARIQSVEIQVQFLGQAAIQEKQFGGWRRRRLAGFVEARQVADARVVERESDIRSRRGHVSSLGVWLMVRNLSPCSRKYHPATNRGNADCTVICQESPSRRAAPDSAPPEDDQKSRVYCRLRMSTLLVYLPFSWP